MDLYQWIYSKDMAAWLSDRPALDLEEQIVCICNAPHRTISEKLEGIRELRTQWKSSQLEQKIAYMETLLNRVYADRPTEQYLYGVEIFRYGEREWFQPWMLFRTAKEAVEEMRKRIEKSAVQTDTKKEAYYGIVQMFYDRGQQSYRHVENLVMRHDGEALFCQPEADNEDEAGSVGGEPFHQARVPYPSGTIVEIEENPFMPSLKGVLVNAVEPDEADFADYNRHYQWMFYPENDRIDRTNGIGIAFLRDDYAPFSPNLDICFPYRQFLRRYEGEGRKIETWLQELSELIKRNKKWSDCIFEERKPGKRVDINRQRLRYVRKMGRAFQGAEKERMT